MKFYDIIWTKAVALLPLFLISSLTAFCQYDMATPYSVFRPGVPHKLQTVSQAGMGGAGIALIDPYKMDFSNPANLAYHMETIFESSGKGSFSTFETNQRSFQNHSFVLDNLSLSFPIKRGKWGMAIGLRPYTTVAYDVVTSLPDPDFEITPQTKYSGDGGISQAYIGMAHTLFSKIDSAQNYSSLAVGANFDFNFGTVDNNRRLVFPGDRNSQAVRLTESTLYRDGGFDFGINYQSNIVKKTLSKNRYLKLLLGATYSLKMDLNAVRSQYVYNFNPVSGFPGDTLSALVREGGSVNIPARIGFGIGLDYVTIQRQRWRFAADYTQQNWSEYKENFADVTTEFRFHDSFDVGAGLEFTPELGASEYLKTIQYRVGFSYSESNLNIRGTELNDVGMSFGISLPLHHRRGLTKSAFHISGKYGKYGTTDNDLIQENYFRLFVGFSFTPHFRNRWFVKPKYD